jgi:hypothetical protein
VRACVRLRCSQRIRCACVASIFFSSYRCFSLSLSRLGFVLACCCSFTNTASVYCNYGGREVTCAIGWDTKMHYILH